FTLLPLRATSEIALSLSPVLADSIRMSSQLIVRASRTFPLPLSLWLSVVLPRFIPRLIQRRLAAKPITGKRWGRVGRQRVAPTGTFPTAPLRTGLDPFGVIRLSRNPSFEALTPL